MSYPYKIKRKVHMMNKRIVQLLVVFAFFGMKINANDATLSSKDSLAEIAKSMDSTSKDVNFQGNISPDVTVVALRSDDNITNNYNQILKRYNKDKSLENKKSLQSDLKSLIPAVQEYMRAASKRYQASKNHSDLIAFTQAAENYLRAAMDNYNFNTDNLNAKNTLDDAKQVVSITRNLN